MSENENLKEEIAELRSQIALLKQEIDSVDDWANGIQLSLIALLPFLLRGHPEVSRAEMTLRGLRDRYLALTDRPSRDEPAARYEAAKMLYEELSLLGAWRQPGR
jgi:hypothetical protein